MVRMEEEKSYDAAKHKKNVKKIEKKFLYLVVVVTKGW